MLWPMLRVCYLGLGHICVILAIIGAILPGMPTVVFLIIAAWAYGRSSEKFQRMIHDHPKYGKMVRQWEQHGVIPVKAKILAGLMMMLSTSICYATAPSPFWPSVLAVFLLAVYAYILSRPSQAPQSEENTLEL